MMKPKDIQGVLMEKYLYRRKFCHYIIFRPDVVVLM